MTFRSVHSLAVQSLAIVVYHKPVKRAWPFQIESVDFGTQETAAEGAPRSGEGSAAVSKLPDGNHGEIISGVTKHD